eukprot:evm.model.NODE_36872_length_18746_cov_20.513550.1
MVKREEEKEGVRDVEANYASFLASLDHEEGTQASLTGRKEGREGERARLGVTTMTGKKKGKITVPVTEEEEEDRRGGGEVLKEVGNSKSNRRKTILKLKKTTKVAAFVPEEDDEGRDDQVEEEEDEALLKTDPVAYKEWIERVPPAGTKVVKGLSVEDCLR